MNSFLVRGSSSLLFIITVAKSLYCSNLIAWKLSNSILVVASFLCNATNYHYPFLLLDYAAIFLVCTSYLNNYYINVPLYLSIAYEYKYISKIDVTKDVAFGLAVLKTLINTYLYVDNYHFYPLLVCSVSSVIVYKIRCRLHECDNQKYNLLLTYLFHICITNITYTASITAI